MPRARVTAARLAQVVCDSSGTRHARRRTYGGDPQLELVTIEAVEHRKIGHASARAEICSGIVELWRTRSARRSRSCTVIRPGPRQAPRFWLVSVATTRCPTLGITATLSRRGRHGRVG